MGSSKKASLKSSFSKYQEKQRKDQLHRSKEAAKADKLKKFIKAGNRNAGKSKGDYPLNHQTAAIIPFTPTDTILLIGEGNFSFTRALFISDHPEVQHLPPGNVTATAYDTEEVCYEKYPDAPDIVKNLRSKGVQIVFGVDATRINSRKEFKGRQWRKIVWNFPHAGKQMADQDRNILANQILILDFLRCAADLLQSGPIPFAQNRRHKHGRPDSDQEQADDESEEDLITAQAQSRGTILITLKNSSPYTLWDVPSLAKKPALSYTHAQAESKQRTSSSQPRYIQLRSFRFISEVWKGYSHRMTKGWVEGIQRGSGGGAEDRTWEFCLAD